MSESSREVVLFQIEKRVFDQQNVIEVSFEPFLKRSEDDETDLSINIVQTDGSLVYVRDALTTGGGV